MKNILLTTTMAFGLGIAAGPSFAQSQQPDASGGQTVCQPGDPNCPASDSSGAAGGTAGQPMDNQAGDATTPKMDSQAGDATAPKVDSQAGDATAPKVDSQAGDATTPKMDSQAGDATAPKVDSQAGDATAPKVDSQAGDATQPTPDGDKTASIGDVEVTAEQKTEVRRVISEVQVDPVELDDIDVDISVGVAVPRTIRVQPLPPRIVEIVPEFEDYVFFVLADGRIIILEPDTYEIVYVLVV
jgi:hypothetical protein